MSFAQPLWLLLAPLLVPLVLLLHARRRQDLVVARLALWGRVESTTAAAPQRRRIPWREPRMWLQVLAIVTVAAALAGPELGPDARPVHWVVVLDASTSMNSVDVEPSRFRAAVATMAERWGRAEGDDTVSIVRADSSAEVVAARWPTGPGLDRALARLEPGHGPPDWAGAAIRVRALQGADDDVRVVVVTDRFGAAGARAAFEGGGRPMTNPIDVVLIGEALVNVGIGEVGAVLRGDRTDQWSVTGRVVTVGFDANETVRVVAAYRPFGGDAFLPWGGVDVTLDDRGAASFEFPLDLPGPGELEIRGPIGDRLPDDDRVIVPLRVEPRRVAVVGGRPPALLRALASIGDLEVFVADTLPDDETAAALDLVIIVGDVAGVPQTSTLWFGAVPAGVAAGEARSGPLDLTVGAHLLVRDLDPMALRLDQAVPLRRLPGVTPLLSAGDALLGWARTTADGRQVVLGFGLSDSDWSAQLSFPAFVAAVVDWAAPRTWSHQPSGCAVGERCPWPADAFAGGWTLRDPSGSSVVEPSGLRAVDADPLASDVWDEAWLDAGFAPQRAGRYALVLTDGVLGLPVVTPPIGDEPIAAGDALPVEPPVAVRDVRPWLVSLAIVLAIADLAWARRTRVPGARRWAWRTASWSVVAIVAWALTVIGVPLPVPGAGGTAVWIGREPPPERLDAGGWSWRAVELSALGSVPTVPEASSPVVSAPVAQDLATALELALATFDEGGARRLIVDGAAVATMTGAAAVDLLERARQQGAVIDVLAHDPPSPPIDAAGDPAEVLTLARLWVPQRVRAGSRFTLGATVQAPDGIPWRLRAELVEVVDAATGDATDEDADAARPEPSASAEAEGSGDDRVEIELRAGAAGTYRYELSLAAEGGADRLGTTTVSVPVGPPLSALLIVPDGAEVPNLLEALAVQSIDVRTVTPFRMPSSLEALAAYDVVALVDVPASELFTAYQEMLETYVRELGGGLVVFGGPRTFGPGGYFRTPLEELSPLSAQITEDAPEVAMAFVLDRSGSMNGAVGTATRMDVAKVATLEALTLLGEQSQAALIVFDTEAQVLLPLRSVQDVPVFEAALSRVNAAGGTSILPGLVAARDLMRASQAATRHIVVMTDGLSQEGDFATVLGELRDLGVSTSFVGVGDAADRRQLTTLADLAGGVLHMALDFRALPGLLAQEALMLSASPIEERPTPTTWTAEGRSAALLEGVTTSPPPVLAGYVQTTAKDEATVLAREVQDDDPILASWRYGLGRVVAFASEVDGPWSRGWGASPGYGRLVSQVLRWTGERSVDDGWTLDVAGADGALDVVLAWPIGAEAPSGPIELWTGDGQWLDTRTPEVGAGREAWVRFEIAPTFRGDLVVRVPDDGDAGPATPLERRLVWPPAPFPPLRSDLVARSQLIESSGGTTWPAEALTLPRVGPVWRWRDASETWLVIGLAAFLVALVARYGAWGAWFGTSARRRR